MTAATVAARGAAATRHATSAAAGAGRRLARRLVSRWRRSLQTRVAVTTFVCSGTVVLLLGVVLMQQVTSGLLDAKVRSALAELGSGVSHAQDQFAAQDQSDPVSLDSTLDRIIGDLAGRGSTGGLYDVALLPSSPGVGGRLTGDVSVASIPSALRQSVEGGGHQAYAFTELRYRDGHREPGLVAGAPVASPVTGPYALYYLFPLRQEAQTVSLVRRTLLFASIALVLLLVGVAALVTRQVVRPVRLAAGTAEQLAAGLLEQRMRVHGEDDLARLATSFNRMAEALQSQIRRLEELSRVQQRFVSDVSHELRTPLTTVRMAADMLHEARADFAPEVGRSAELLQRELDRFEALLGDLLEISRHDAGAVVLDQEPTDLRPLVERVVATVESLAARRGTTLRVDLPGVPVVADIDGRRVERVLRNLVSNAVEHGDGAPVDVTLRAGSSSVAVTVRDYGVGLDAAHQALVFNRFWRGDPARARTTGGTGLGLAIALEDTRLHGGWLEVWSRRRAGCLFRLTLPCHAGETLMQSPLPLRPIEDGPMTRLVPASRRPLPGVGGGRDA